MHHKNLGATLTGGSDDIALIDYATGNGVEQSYDAIDALTDRASAHVGAPRGARIGLLGANSASFVATLFGIMRAGCVAVPVNTRFPATTIEHVISDAALQRVYVDQANEDRIPQDLRVPLMDPNAAPAADDTGALTVPATGEAGLVLYTSGSTGRPKGVELSHDSQWAMVERLQQPLAGRSGIVAAPLYHMNGLLFLMSLLAGRGTVVLMPRFDARTYLQAVHDHRVSVITGVPTMLSLMMKERELINRLDLDRVAAVQVGSAPLSETLCDQVSGLFPNARLTNGYGTTEAGAGIFGPHPDGRPVPPLSLGHPQPHVDVRLVGDDAPHEGVLEVRTPAAMSGYLNQPEKTAAKMDTEGWIDTGDIMRRDASGFYYFVGRDDDMFNCGGENVYPGEVERVLERDARIAECCVVPVPDDIKGEKPVAFVVAVPESELDEDTVKAVALADMPAYMHPRRVFFLDTMPLAGTNKIDRRTLTEQALRMIAAG